MTKQNPIDAIQLNSSVTMPLSKTADQISGTFYFRPQKIQTHPGKEFHLAILEENLFGLAESVLTVSFNPNLIEFIGISEDNPSTRKGFVGGASIITKPGVGQVVLHIRLSPHSRKPGDILANLIFKGKQNGTTLIGMTPAFAHDVTGKNLAFSAQAGTIAIQ